MESSSERNARHLDYNRQVALTDNPSSLVARLQAQKHTCRRYIARLKMATEELERVKEENTRLEKENATLIELLPGRGGSRKHNAMHGSTRRKRH